MRYFDAWCAADPADKVQRAFAAFDCSGGFHMNSYLRMASLSAALLMLLGAAPARATAYTYEGSPFTSNSTPSLFGTHITGTITLSVDTASFTGGFVGPSPGGRKHFFLFRHLLRCRCLRHHQLKASRMAL